MKAITLTQPWATLVAIGAKRIETRSWSTRYRGPVAIHAAKSYPRWARETCDEGPFRKALGRLDPNGLLRGYVVATANLVAIVPTISFIEYFEKPDPQNWPCPFEGFALTPDDFSFGDFAEGRYAWLLADVKPLPTPVPASGKLGLWEWKEVRQ